VVLDAALKDGRLTAAMAELPAIKALDSASLKALVDTLKPVVPVARLDLPASPELKPALTADQLKVCEMFGHKPEDVAGIKIGTEGILSAKFNN
jgi:hypothetical protein